MGSAASADHDWGAALMVGLQVAREAGRILLRYRDELAQTFEGADAESAFRRKSSRRDLVTEADVETERYIVRALREHLPGHAIEAEEEVHDAQDERPRWFVDPLDGTVNFVQGLPLFCVSLGLHWKGQPRVAVIHAPVLGETYFARIGHGAFRMDKAGQHALGVSTKTELAESILGTGFPYRREEWQPNNLEIFSSFYLDVRGMRRLGSAALDLALVAAGRLDGFWELYLSPHDVAAGVLLVTEAGGVVTDSKGGQDWLRGGHIVAAGPELHPQILTRVLSPDPRWNG